jgi:hypothetical protein
VDTLTAHPHHLPVTTRNESVTRWSRRARGALGFITFALIGIFGGAGVHALLTPAVQPHQLGSAGEIQFALLFATFLQFLLTLFYVSFAAQNPRSDARWGWIAGMVLLPFAVMPVYWWVHIWNAPFIGNPKKDHAVPGGEITPDAD